MSVFKRWNGTQWEIIGPGVTSARFDNINNMIASEFDPQKTYNIGDYVVQSDKLYRCIKKIGTPQSWNNESWLEIKLGPDVTNLRNNIVAVSNTQPTDENNRLWVKPDNNSMQIPLMEDVMQLPTPNDYGETNQIPRSTGTGIEWVDYGLPSDQQTADAIDAWLDAHPEATTTVQDNSITYGKLNTNLLGGNIPYTTPFINEDGTGINWQLNYVTPQMFGARGDGITDDTEAFAALAGKTAFIPAGTYIVSHVEYPRQTSLCGAGMGKTIIQQKENTDADLFDFANADSSMCINMTLLGQENEARNNIYRALLKIRTTSEQSPRYWTCYSRFEHLTIRNAPGSGLVLLGSTHTDPEHQDSAGNWVLHINDLRIEECKLWCMIDQSSDNLFSNLYLNEGGLGNLKCSCSSNMYCNIKLDQPYNAGDAGHVEGFDDGALILLNTCGNVRFINVDVQSAAQVGIKITNSTKIHMDGDVNNCGLKTEGRQGGVGLIINSSQDCDFNLSMHQVTPGLVHKHNVQINSCRKINVYLMENDKSLLGNINDSPESCFIIEPYTLSKIYNDSFIKTMNFNNLVKSPLIENFNDFTHSTQGISLDTNNKIVGPNSIRIDGNIDSSLMIYQTINNLKSNHNYLFAVVLNVETLPTIINASATPVPYIMLYDFNKEARTYAAHQYGKNQTGNQLLCTVGKSSNDGRIQIRMINYKNNSISYFGNILVIDLDDLGISTELISMPINNTYETIYQILSTQLNEAFISISLTYNYENIMPLLKYLLDKI